MDEVENNEKTTETKPTKGEQSIEEPPKIPFECSICHFQALCDYKGNKPKFTRHVQFGEDCYVMRDPFSAPPGHLSSKSTCENLIIIGSDCSICKRSICSSNTCGIFYQRTFCSQCAQQTLHEFPVEIQKKIHKFLTS